MIIVIKLHELMSFHTESRPNEPRTGEQEEA